MTLPVMPSLPGLTWPLVRRGPIFDTAKETSLSGKTARYPRRTNPKWQWELNFSAIFQQFGLCAPGTNADLATLTGFFSSLYGGAYPFLYLDSQDNAVRAQSIGTGTGSATAFQLVRTFGGFTEKVQAVNGPIAVYVGSTLKTLGTDFTIGSTGIVTFASAPSLGAAITWTGSFYWVCEFDDDQIEFSQFVSGVSEVKKLTFSSKLL